MTSADRTCGRLSLVAGALAAALVLCAPVAEARVYGGSVGPEPPFPVYPDPFYIATSSAGTLTGLGLTFSVVCLPDAFPVTVGTHRVRLRSSVPPGVRVPDGVLVVDPKGKGFSATMTQPERSGERIDLQIDGTMTSRRARGSVRARITTADQSRTCESPVLRWRAVRDPGRIYAGSNPGIGPIVLRRNKNELELTPGFVTDCEPSGWLRAAVRLLVGVRGGRFDDRIAADVPQLSFDYRYDVAGRVGSRRVSGTFALRIRRFTDGVVSSTCRAPTTRWSAVTG